MSHLPSTRAHGPSERVCSGALPQRTVPSAAGAGAAQNAGGPQAAEKPVVRAGRALRPTVQQSRVAAGGSYRRVLSSARAPALPIAPKSTKTKTKTAQDQSEQQKWPSTSKARGNGHIKKNNLSTPKTIGLKKNLTKHSPASSKNNSKNPTPNQSIKTLKTDKTEE